VSNARADANERPRIQRLKLSGFRSIQALDLEFKPINVLIGANGSGKSNLIEFLRMLRFMADSTGQLRGYVGTLGGASQLLHFGSAISRVMAFEIELNAGKGANRYAAELAGAAGGTLVFLNETYLYAKHSAQSPLKASSLGAGHAESKLGEATSETPKVIQRFLREIRVHQFHNSSFNSPLRASAALHSARHLHESGGQLAAVLKRIQDTQPERYRWILDYIRLIYPSFLDFEFIAMGDASVRLGWRERMNEYVFDIDQASDGTVRFFALVTILLADPEELPSILIIDEPELGLHPAAIEVLASLIRAASEHCQLVIATQSPQLIDQFDPEDIITVERRHGQSRFERLNRERLKPWLEEFGDAPGEPISDLWIRNAIGGGPSA
jgi:predicted ATPase